MIARIVQLALERRLLVFVLTLALVGLGVRGYLGLSVDAVPDVTSVQVQVLTRAPGLSPLEVESLVTRPVELSMSGLPGANAVRSVSRTAVSAVTIVFDDDVPLLRARELVAQRLPAAREAIPERAGTPQMGPLSTGLGEVYHFTLAWPGHTSTELRTLLDWEIAPSLRSVPGVVEVNGWGGDQRQIEVRLRTEDLRAHGVTQLDVEHALLSSGQNAGGGALERSEEQILVRLDAQYRSVEDVAQQVVATRHHGAPVLVQDVAEVRNGVAPRVAAATADGEPTQYVMVQMVAGGNAHEVVSLVKARLAEVQKRLPPSVEVRPFYDRAAFVERVLGTVWKSLFEGGLVVLLVLLVFLGDMRAGFVVATVIPLSMLGAFALMHAFDVSGNLMSLGAIDFGLVVDGAVVIVEGALATMAIERTSARVALAGDAERYGKAIAFGVMMIAVVYVPVLLLEGVEGKMFRPMAITVLFALGTALVLSFTWVPAFGSLVLRSAHAGDPWVLARIRRVYEPLLARFTRRRAGALLVAGVLGGVGILALSRLGADFVPRLEEGDLVVQITRPPSVSLREAELGTSVVERALLEFPEVQRVVSRTGSPDVATDVMGLEQTDMFIVLAPRSEWTTASEREDLIAHFEEALERVLPGSAFGFTQPIEMRIQELLGGAKSDVGIKVFGDDLPAVQSLAAQIGRDIARIPGAADVRVEPSEGLPVLTLRPDPRRMGRLGVDGDAVRATVEALREGREVGLLAEGNRRFPIQVRWDRPPGPEVDELRRSPLLTEGGRSLLLGDVVDVELQDVPAQLSREQGRRRILVEANVRGRDLASFVRDVESVISRLSRPEGTFVEVTGQYENLVRAATRLAFVVPATLLTIFVLLYLAFGQARPALLILLNVPAAASGGFVALYARDLPLSISAAVGFIALFGVATMNGVVLLSAIREHSLRGAEDLEAARRGASERLRPVVTTAVVASLGFLPMAIATGTGAEVQRPLATVVMGGLVTATVLTLLVLPALTIRRPRRGAAGEAPVAASTG